MDLKFYAPAKFSQYSSVIAMSQHAGFLLDKKCWLTYFKRSTGGHAIDWWTYNCEDGGSNLTQGYCVPMST